MPVSIVIPKSGPVSATSALRSFASRMNAPSACSTATASGTPCTDSLTLVISAGRRIAITFMRTVRSRSNATGRSMVARGLSPLQRNVLPPLTLQLVPLERDRVAGHVEAGRRVDALECVRREFAASTPLKRRLRRMKASGVDALRSAAPRSQRTGRTRRPAGFPSARPGGNRHRSRSGAACRSCSSAVLSL